MRLGRAGPRVLLQETVCMLAPPSALADELDLRLALARHEGLERRRGEDDLRAGHLGERRAFVSEDPRVAVLVGGDPASDAQLVQQPCEHAHRMLVAGVLDVRLDTVEGGLGAHARDLELRDERDALAVGALHVGDRPFGREEREPGQVLDVALIEDDEARWAPVGQRSAEPLPSLAELVGADASRHCDPATILVSTARTRRWVSRAGAAGAAPPPPRSAAGRARRAGRSCGTRGRRAPRQPARPTR